MPDTGERREIKRRVETREAELVSESKKLREQSRMQKEGFDAAEKKRMKKNLPGPKQK